MCYCDSNSSSILNDIKRDTIPNEALARDCCWREICRVRGSLFSSSDYETYNELWREISAKRGYLRTRQNPRGF